MKWFWPNWVATTSASPRDGLKAFFFYTRLLERERLWIQIFMNMTNHRRRHKILSELDPFGPITFGVKSKGAKWLFYPNLWDNVEKDTSPHKQANTTVCVTSAPWRAWSLTGFLLASDERLCLMGIWPSIVAADWTLVLWWSLPFMHWCLCIFAYWAEMATSKEPWKKKIGLNVSKKPYQILYFKDNLKSHAKQLYNTAIKIYFLLLSL